MASVPPTVPHSPDCPRLELSGPKLARALESLITGAEDYGGVERYVEALKLKSALFQSALADGHAPGLSACRALFAHLATVRRRVGAYLEPQRFNALQTSLLRLLEDRENAATTDARLNDFCAAFPDDRGHRWVRDLAAEILHNVDPERYPLMCRWVWDAGTNTGVIREIWHGADAALARIELPDRYATFVMFREELAQFLSKNGVFRDVLHYVDLLTAQVYAGYLSEQGDSYLRTDFTRPEDPTGHARRLLGLDGPDARGRTRLKAADGTAVIAPDADRLN